MGLQEGFENYLKRPAAIQATRSLSNGIGVEFRIADTGEVFHISRQGGTNKTVAGPAPHPEVVFTMNQPAAQAILEEPSEEIGTIGIHVAKQILSQDPARKVALSLKVGFFALFTQGYLGVLKEGGGVLASFLASKGLGGMDSIKTVIKKLKGHA